MTNKLKREQAQGQTNFGGRRSSNKGCISLPQWNATAGIDTSIIRKEKQLFSYY